MMKKMVRPVITVQVFVMFFVLLSFSAAYADKRFYWPKVDGTPLDWCLTAANACGDPAADYFCRMRGFRRAGDYEKAPHMGHTISPKSGDVCNGHGCDGFRFIDCTGHREHDRDWDHDRERDHDRDRY